MFSNPITSPLLRERNLPYRGTTLTTLLDSRLTVFATAPPQPASNDFASTRALVPGGPEPSRNGLGNLIPLTVIERSIDLLLVRRELSSILILRFGDSCGRTIRLQVFADDTVGDQRSIKGSDRMGKIEIDHQSFGGKPPA